MKKILSYSIIAIVIFGILFNPSLDVSQSLTVPQADAQISPPTPLYTGNIGSQSFGVPSVLPSGIGSNTSNLPVGSVDDSCGLTHLVACAKGAVQSVLQWIGDMVLEIVGIFLWISGAVILDTTLQYTLINMGATLQKITALYSSWQAVRDALNIFFIFILLYTAIGTMFGLEKVNWKKTVVQLILVAIFINFTLFMTQALVDFSNVVSYGFYNAIPGAANVPSLCSGGSAGTKGATGLGISGALMQCLKLETIYNNTQTNSGSSVSSTGNVTTTGSFAILPFLVTMIMGIIVILISSFIFLITAILFGIRFVILIFLMITSPVAFAGYLLPKMASYSQKWWGALTAQLTLAPIFMMMLWLSMRVIGGIQSVTISSSSNGFGTIASGALGGSAALGQIQGSFSIIFNFSIVIAFLILSLYVAKQSGAVGMDFAKKYAGKGSFGAAGWLGRNTAGRVASRLENNERFQKYAGRSAVGQMLYSGTKGVARSSFDARAINKEGQKFLGAPTGKEGYAGQLSEQIKRQTATYEGLGTKEAKAEYANRVENSPLNPFYSKFTLLDSLGRSDRVVVAQHKTNVLKKEIEKLTKAKKREKEERGDTPEGKAEIVRLNNEIETRQAEVDRLEKVMMSNKPGSAKDAKPKKEGGDKKEEKEDKDEE